MKKEIFDIIKDPVNYKHNKADGCIRNELVKIKDAVDLIDMMVFELAETSGLVSTIQARTREIEEMTIEIAKDLDNYQEENADKNL